MASSSCASTTNTNQIPRNPISEDNLQTQDNVQDKPPEVAGRGRGTKRRSSPSDTTTVEPAAKKGKKRSWVWGHFDEVTMDGKKRAVCNYCSKDVCGDGGSGTTVMANHLVRCPTYPPNIDKNQKLLAMQSDITTKSASVFSASDKVGERRGRLELWKFNQQDSRIALSKMIIMDEKPFRTVEHDGFRLFMSVVCPHFLIPSRWTVARDCFGMYQEEKIKLKTYFSKLNSRICLTTDTWTSCQNLSYMCLTAHFIDENWVLQKKIINFCPIVGHTGEIIGKTIENCLIEWGITSKILTVTVDNASANDVGVEYLKERLISWNGAVLGGDFLQMRCASHILSLTVKEGLKESDDSIYRVRNAVRFVRSSPARLLKFNVCVKKEQITSVRHLCLDVETRWNSTYLMLDSAIIYRKAFHKLETSDGGKFQSELNKNRGVPDDEDWERVASLLPFLKIFYDATLRLSGSLYVTSNVYLQEILGVSLMIKSKCQSSDVGVCLMAAGMKRKHDKYWDNVDKVNILLYIAVILDPRRKMQYVKWAVNQQYDSTNAEILRDKVMETLNNLFTHYTSSQPPIVSSPRPTQVDGVIDCDETEDWQDMVESQFERAVSGEVVNDKSDLDKYLGDVREVNSKKFDVLDWWKKRAETYPTLSLMARDVLAIPVSTVASESAFSTGGRILDQFRSSLTSRMVEGLVCAQDWLRTTNGPLLAEEYVEEVENIDKELAEASPSSCDDYF